MYSPLINHPKGTFYNDNKNILLWQAVKASCAAPTFFIPQMINVGKSEYAAFVDGGVSMANNPALILLLIATLRKVFLFNGRWVKTNYF